MSEPLFELSRVEYRYPGARTAALRDVSLSLDPGFTVLIGPNGAGKSTIVRLLSGTARPTCGGVRFLGVDIADWSRAELARRMAVVQQEPPAAVPRTVHEYVALGRNPYVSPWTRLGADDERIITDSLERTGLEELASRSLTDLSGGERQRAKLARALAQEPRVLLLDEPTAHLDVGHALWAFEWIADLVVRQRVDVICITHDMNLASRFASTLVLVSEGRVTARGPAADVLGSPELARAYRCEMEVRDAGPLGRCVLPVATALDAEAAAPDSEAARSGTSSRDGPPAGPPAEDREHRDA